MVEQVTFQTLFQFLQTVGILVGVYYYITTIRTNQKNQELQLETRQAQLFMQWYQRFMDSTEGINALEVLKSATFDTVEEYLQLKESDEVFQKTMNELSLFYEGLGVIVKEGLLNLRWIATMWSGPTTHYWALMEPVLEDLRVHYEYPRFLSETEYICREVMKYIDEHPEFKP
jgi:hypothetical protein